MAEETRARQRRPQSGFPEHFDNAGSTHTRDFPTIAADPGPGGSVAGNFNFPHRHFEMLPNSLDRKILSPHGGGVIDPFWANTKENSSEKFSSRTQRASVLPGALRAAPRRPAASAACTSWNGEARSSISAALQLRRSQASRRSSQLSTLSISASSQPCANRLS